MKFLPLIVALLTSTSALAADQQLYLCNMRDVVTGQVLIGSSFRVVTDDDQLTASVYSTVVFPGAQPVQIATLTAEEIPATLPIITRFSGTMGGNTNVSFTREVIEAGALSISNKAGASTYMCTAVN